MAGSTDTPRLIEVAFPLKQASLASVHEKSVNHGHISTLHIWPARRPLAASRAALLATLLPDPGDAEQRKALLEKIGGAVGTKVVKDTDEDGNTFEEEKEVVTGGVLAWGQEIAPEMEAFRQMIRNAYGGRAPKVMDPFAGGGAIPLEAMRLGCEVTAADINPVAWFVLKCTLQYPQQFAGEKWPLPEFVRQWPDFIDDFLAGKIKKRKGAARAHFSDDKQTELFRDALPDADLAWHVRAWGRWVLERAGQDLACRYPVIGGEPTVAYLWARTARDKLTAGPIPLLKTFWLCKKAGRRAALLPIPTQDKKLVRFALLQETELKNPERVIDSHPVLAQWEVTADTFIEFLNKGTMNRAGVWSPLSGRPGMIALTMDDLRRQGQQGLLGTQMTATVVEKTEVSRKESKKGSVKETRKTRKAYRLPVPQEMEAARVETEDLDDAFRNIPFGIPEEPLPQGGGSGAGRAFSIPKYGFKKWRDIFTHRQLLALAKFIQHGREAMVQIGSNTASQAIGSYLCAVLDRVIDRSSAICTWQIDSDKIRNTFARWALPMAWDFCELAPLMAASGGYSVQLELVAEYIQHALLAAKGQAHVVRRSAISNDVQSLNCVITDPPYYDAIPYSDLMDVFHVWIKRHLSGLVPEIDAAFSSELSPKWDHEYCDGELIDDDSRFAGDRKASKANYESGMGKAFRAQLGCIEEAGRLVVVFANKSVAAWETLIGGLIQGGATVIASWPIQTERPNRMRGQTSAALSSSVWIVCRKRSKTAQAGWEENVLDAMRRTLFDPRDTLGGRNILQYFFDLGIRGPDFIWAALGPALEAYSAHPFVKKTAGGVVTVPEFLAEVRRLVLHFALGELPGFKNISQQTQGRGESLEIDPVTQYYLLHRAYFGLEAAPAGACIMYANACGKSDNELKMVWHVIEQGGKSKRGRPSSDELQDIEDEGDSESKGNEFKLVPWDERAKRDDLGETRNGQPAPLIDRLHRLMRLFQQNRTAEVQQLYDAWGLANDRAFPPMLQAVRELALHDREDTERRLVEALATQLKLNRRQVEVHQVVNDQMEMRVMETDVFAPVEELKQQPVTYRAATKKRKKA